MRFRILGPVGASGPGGEVPLGGPRHRVLLATLLITPGRVVSTDRLIEALWGDAPPRRAVEMLHVRISELRKQLRAGSNGGADLIIRDGLAICSTLRQTRLTPIAVSDRQPPPDGH